MKEKHYFTLEVSYLNPEFRVFLGSSKYPQVLFKLLPVLCFQLAIFRVTRKLHSTEMRGRQRCAQDKAGLLGKPSHMWKCHM